METKELIPLENPSACREWHDYLAYLLEYHPETAWELYKTKELEQLLNNQATRIVNLEQDLLKQMEKDQAQELAYETYMSSNTDLPEQEIFQFAWEDRQRDILAWADKISSSPR